MEINLQAHRCPTAQILMNRALEAFMASEATELVISTIEPSLLRNTEARLAGLDLKAEVASVHSREISDKDLQIWQERFDEDDYGDVKNVVTIAVSKAV
ncbi:MAG: hypothetical protein CML22_07175 [Rheinheimera sp.]|nr:hypothetical protein [Rheinheimera sp.]MBM34065.1 hypothetical protein [Rheinheimera sp.]|tara:strand:- start:55882 stop:56178 length:297 start_codon:yes stop_codon:yes gene_type:complete